MIISISKKQKNQKKIYCLKYFEIFGFWDNGKFILTNQNFACSILKASKICSMTHDLEILSPNDEKAPLLSIANIAAKFEDATPCSYRDMLRTKKNRQIGSFFKISKPWPWSIEPALLWNGTSTQHRQYCCKVWRCYTL